MPGAFVTGRVTGPSRELAPNLVGFVVEEGIPFERISIPRYNALPSYCPFLRWDLEVRALSDSKWEILRIIRVTPLSPDKAEIKRVLVEREKRSSDIFEVWIGKELRKLKMPLSYDDIPEKLWVLSELMRDALQEDPFYELLPFFCGDYLARLTNEERGWLYSVLRTEPDAFVHWSVASRFLANRVRKDKLTFSPGDLGNKNREGLRYDKRCPAPCLPLVKMLAPGCQEAFEFDRELSASFYWQGHRAKACSPEALPRVNAYGAYYSESGLTTPLEWACAEAKLACALRALRSVTAIQCSDYGSAFAVSFLELLSALKSTALVVCAHATGARHLKLLAEIDAKPLDEMTRENKRVLVLDRAHKIGPDLLLWALEKARPAELVLVGDVEEVPAHWFRGGGDLFRDVCESALAKRVEWKGASDKMEKVRESLRRRAPAKLTMSEAESVPVAKKMFAKLWKAYKAPKALVLCSSFQEQKLVGEWIGVTGLRIGSRVQFLNDDEVGILTGAKNIHMKTELPRGKDATWGHSYAFTADCGGPIARTADLDVAVRADVALVARYPGPTLKSVIFVAGPRCRLEEVIGATKYAQVNFALLCMPNCALTSMEKNRIRRRSLMPMLLR